MQNVNFGGNHGVRHAYAYGHAKKEVAAGFKDAIANADDKPTVAKSFKDAILSAQLKPETKPAPETVAE